MTITAPLSYKPNYSYAVFDAIAAHEELFDGVVAMVAGAYARCSTWIRSRSTTVR